MQPEQTLEQLTEVLKDIAMKDARISIQHKITQTSVGLVQMVNNPESTPLGINNYLTMQTDEILALAAKHQKLIEINQTEE